ncbi:MAG: hypothetical protein U0452_14185 [Anaerolineae bacterium]
MIQGPIDPAWVDYFGDLVVSAQVKNGRITMTSLLGTLPDLAAFIGLVERVQNRDLPVLSAHYDRTLDVTRDTSVTESEPS